MNLTGKYIYGFGVTGNPRVSQDLPQTYLGYNSSSYYMEGSTGFSTSRQTLAKVKDDDAELTEPVDYNVLVNVCEDYHGDNSFMERKCSRLIQDERNKAFNEKAMKKSCLAKVIVDGSLYENMLGNDSANDEASSTSSNNFAEKNPAAYPLKCLFASGGSGKTVAEYREPIFVNGATYEYVSGAVNGYSLANGKAVNANINGNVDVEKVFGINTLSTEDEFRVSLNELNDVEDNKAFFASMCTGNSYANVANR